MQTIPVEYIETATLAADKARTITQRWFRANLDIENKPDSSPVTVADQETEHAVREIILGRHPDHSFLGEETGAQVNNEEWEWIIDPIDGTKSFATGNPTFGTLVSLLHEQKPVLGIIDHPMLNERWIGVKGQTTSYNGKPCQTRRVVGLERASIYATNLDVFDATSFPLYDKRSRYCQFRVFGGDCYAMLTVCSPTV